MFKNLSEKPVSGVQHEQVEKWKEEDLLGKCVSEREGCPSFIFYEGPPTANGRPGIHNVIGENIKGFDKPLQDDAGISGKEKSRLGYSRTACGNRS